MRARQRAFLIHQAWRFRHGGDAGSHTVRAMTTYSSPRRAGFPVGATVATVVLAVLGAPVALLCMIALAFAGDACHGGRTPICSVAIQQLVVWLPPVSLLAGLVLCVIGIVRAVRGHSAFNWVTAGWLVFSMSVAAAYVIATSGT